MESSSPINPTEQANIFDLLQYSGAVRFLRGSVTWAIKIAIAILGVVAFPIVLVCFLVGSLLFIPILALLQGFRFVWVFFGFKFQFPKLWSNPFAKKKSTELSRNS